MSLINDILGWGLTILGIGLILFMIYAALNNLILLSMSLSIPATIVFRAGIAFLKMNSAYRLAQNLNRNPNQNSQA